MAAACEVTGPDAASCSHPSVGSSMHQLMAAAHVGGGATTKHGGKRFIVA